MPTSGAPTTSKAWREWSIASVCAVALTALLTYPTIVKFDSAGRLDTNDGNFSIWNVAWVAHALLSDRAHLFDANIFHPHPHTLTYSELNLVAGLFAIPVYAETHNALAAINSAILIALVICFLSTWALVRRLTGSSGAGLLAATGYTFSAYTSSHTAQIQLLMIFGFPLTMLAFHRLVDRPGVLSGVCLGASIALTALACGYYGVYAAGVVGLAAIWWMRKRAAYWIGLGVAVVVAAALVLPILVPYVSARTAQGVVRGANGANVDELRHYSADIRAHLTSSTDFDVKWFHALYRNGQAPKEVLFPGIIVLVLAGVGLVVALRDRQARSVAIWYAALALVAFWGSFGPNLGLYRLLMHLPGMSFLRVPARMAVIDIFALSVLAGFGCAWLARQRGWLPLVLTTALVGELIVPWPLVTMPPVPRAYQMLANAPRGPVVELPFPYDAGQFHQHAKAMLMSTFHWQPMVNGYSDYIPPDFRQIAPLLNNFPDPVSFEIMRERGVRYVIWKVHEYGIYQRSLAIRLPAYRSNLRLMTDDEGIRLFEIVSWPAPRLLP